MLPGLRRAVVLGATLVLTSLLPAPAQGVPPGWTDPVTVPGTSGDFNQVSATSPDGADLVVWIDGGSTSGSQIKARLRMPGSPRWDRIFVRVDNQASVQDLSLASSPSGDFWLAWVTYTEPGPEIFVQRLDTSRRRWSDPRQVFVQSGYRHAAPSLAVAGTGTVVVGAYAQPVVATSPPTYRAVVATLDPGQSVWQSTFLSPATDFSGGASAAAGASGELAVSFVRGYKPSSMRVFTAVRPAGAGSGWQLSRLSVRGDSQRVSAPSVGADGTVAVAWGAPASAANTVRVAATRIRARPQAWSVQDAQPAGLGVLDPAVVVDQHGAATVLWRQDHGGNVILIQARRFVAGILGAPVTVSASGELGDLRSIRLRADGKVALLTQQFSTTVANLGLRYRLLAADGPRHVRILTDGTEPHENQARLGLTVAGRPTVIYTQGFPPPDTRFAALGETPKRPVVVRGADDPARVRAAKVVGRPRVGERLTCRSGFWVEARSLTVTWRRDGRPVATGPGYRVRSRDSGHGLSCEVRAVNDVGGHTVGSPRRRVA